MRPDDAIRIRHMMDAARVIHNLTAGRCRADLDHDVTVQLALVRAIEIAGEAASKISPELRSSAPAIPWQAIVAMRNRLIHAYFDIDLDLIWETAIHEIPLLESNLRKLI